MLSLKETIFKGGISISTRSLITHTERASFLFSFLKKSGASLTLEASLVLPLFLFYVMTLLYGLEIIRFQSDVWQALNIEITRGSFEAYQYEYAEVNGVIADKNFSLLSDDMYIQNIKDYLDKQILPYLCVDKGRDGLMVTIQENISDTDNRSLTVTYKIKPFLYLMPIGDMKVTDKVVMHDFTGYRREKDAIWGKSGEEGIYVFVTPNGEKYHFSENCTYLKVKLQAVDSSEVNKHRNMDGEIYRSCEVCGNVNCYVVYVTKWGNRYHTKMNCNAIQKNVQRVLLSQVGGRTACSKCGN